MIKQRYSNDPNYHSARPVLPTNSNTTAPLLVQAPFGRDPKVVRIVLLRGFFGGLGVFLHFYSMKTIPLGDEVTIHSLYSVFTPILAIFTLGEHMDMKKLIAVLASVTGAILIANPSFPLTTAKPSTTMDENYYPIGYATALIGSLFGAGVVITIRKAGNLGAHSLNLVFSWAIFGSGISVIMGTNHFISSDMLKEGPWVWNLSMRSWGLLFGTVFFGGVSNVLMNFAGKLAPAGLGSIAMSNFVGLFDRNCFIWTRIEMDNLALSLFRIVFTSFNTNCSIS